VWVGVPEEDVAWVAWVGGSGKNEGEVCRIAIDPWALPVVTTPLPVWLLPPWCLPPMPLQAPRGPPPPPRSAARPPPSPPVPLTAPPPPPPPNPTERIPDQWTLRADHAAGVHRAQAKSVPHGWVLLNVLETLTKKKLWTSLSFSNSVLKTLPSTQSKNLPTTNENLRFGPDGQFCCSTQNTLTSTQNTLTRKPLKKMQQLQFFLEMRR